MTVVNTTPVPVTLQGGTPVTATIQGAVTTTDANPPGSEPYQHEFFINMGSTNSSQDDLSVPSGKILIIRYISGALFVGPAEAPVFVSFSTDVGGGQSPHLFPVEFVGSQSGHDYYELGQDTWIEAGPGTDIAAFAVRNGTTDLGLLGNGNFTISGYLIDAPTTP